MIFATTFYVDWAITTGFIRVGHFYPPTKMGVTKTSALIGLKEVGCERK